MAPLHIRLIRRRTGTRFSSSSLFYVPGSEAQMYFFFSEAKRLDLGVGNWYEIAFIEVVFVSSFIEYLTKSSNISLKNKALILASERLQFRRKDTKAAQIIQSHTYTRAHTHTHTLAIQLHYLSSALLCCKLQVCMQNTKIWIATLSVPCPSK